MQSAREYLFAQGLAKMGRGRFSAEAKAALAQAMSSGEVFSDYSQTSPTAVPLRNAATPTVRTARVTKTNSHVAVKIQVQEVQRTESFMSITEKNGTLVVLSDCKCGKSIRMCKCASGPVPPSYLDVASVVLI